jgi:chlorite dismutase
MNPRLYSFVGSSVGPLEITECTSVIGQTLPAASYLHITNEAHAAVPTDAHWVLQGATSNTRYTTREEKAQLEEKQAPLDRPEATHGAVIPIRKSAAWWALTQDERRAIFEDRSHHTAIGLKYLPAIARRLHHCRDLSSNEPFDFITLFDFAQADTNAFNDLLAALRTTEEWKYVEREVDIRFVRQRVTRL